MSIGRPLQHQPEEALKAAINTFWRSGYYHTSMRDLLDAMALSRSSLYQAFGNKEALFLLSLQNYRDELLASLAEQLDAANSAWSFIEQLLYSAADTDSQRASLGCLLFNSATELGGEDSLPAQTARDSVASINAFFSEVIKRAQQEGSIADTRDPESAAQFLTLSMSGLRLLMKNGASKHQAQQTVDFILRGLG
ncbi:MAG: Transcriptional regulator [Halomonas sp. HL-48]|nr:TetR/AcrR family transcriptional regulator [Halomonas sp. HL-48]KPQ26197.1 MAG: Transcriptional regulator [Halomonas sp. HL-48]